MPANTPFTDRPSDIAAIKKRFLAINRERLERTRSALRDRQRDFFDLLPLLFHANHPMLPGFVSKQTPVGVSDYSPSKRTLEVAKRHVRSFDYKRRALPTYDIHAIYVMGSIGTIAYSDKSDFDIWVVHRLGITDALRDELRHKVREIEKLAGQLDLEVHFFLMDTGTFIDGSHDDLSRESSGTAQHCLLLEEFYRTGLLIAGRYPAWWLVPPDEEVRYDDYVRDLRRRRFIRDDECVDFGGVPTIPAEEFFGAALWQLSKGIDSPYKSVLKLMLMEIYAHEHPRVDLLCSRFKRDIYRGETNLNNLDPYLALYRRIEDYLTELGDAPRLELVRRCFYFKVNERLSTPDNPRFRTWQRELLMELVAAWKWDARHLEMLDGRGRWKVDRVAQERRSLVEQLTASYRLLSAFARENSQLSLISQQDLNVLGRKLYAAFERKAGKIEVLNRGISDELWEGHLHMQPGGQQGGENWLLYRGGTQPGDGGAPPALLKRGRGAAELLAWCYFNGLIDGSTLLTLGTPDGGVTTKELREMLRCLQRHFDLRTLGEPALDALMKAPRVSHALLFINVGVDPLLAHTREGKHLTTIRTDALSYGGLGENLALTFDQVIATSWNEVLTYRFTGPDALMECLCNYLQWNPPGRDERPTPFHAYSFSSSRGPSIAQRLEELFKDIVTAYYHSSAPQAFRYVLRVKHHHYVLYAQDGTFGFHRVESQDELLRYLAAPRGAFGPTVIDRYALGDTPLPVICMTNEPGAVQLYYYLDAGRASVYVMDEMGSLFTYSQPYGSAAVLLDQYGRFLKAIRKRQELQRDVRDARGAGPYETRCYQLKKGSGQRRWRLDRQESFDIGGRRRFFDVQVIGEMGADDKPVFTFYCDGREFSTLEHGAALYEEVGRHILNRRSGGEPYPLYITDIDIPPRAHGGDSGGPLQTIHYLTYKKLIEERLNEAVERLAKQAVA